MSKDKQKQTFTRVFLAVVLLLAIVRFVFPGIATPRNDFRPQQEAVETPDEVSRPHPIRSVASYEKAFPDSNHVQLVAARRWGITPLGSRDEALHHQDRLVHIGLSPYYSVDPLQSSIPYLVPRAAVLLNDIARAFQDSLSAKHLPLQRLIVTSVLRTRDDVRRLQRTNGNATEESCHLYGTTLDITYIRYHPLGQNRPVRDDTLKWVLSEVLRDFRTAGRCYVKHEKREKCFHMTVR